MQIKKQEDLYIYLFWCPPRSGMLEQVLRCTQLPIWQGYNIITLHGKGRDDGGDTGDDVDADTDNDDGNDSDDD